MNIDFIPNALYEILTLHRNKTLSVVKKNYDSAHDEMIDDYMEFLISKNFGFWCDLEDVDLFPDINLQWDGPELITNAIIDVSASSCHNFERISEELSHLGCKALQIRFFCDRSIDDLREIIPRFHSGTLRHIDLLLKYNSEISIEQYEELCIQNQKIFSITLHSSPEEILSEFQNTLAYVQAKTKVLNGSDHCGVVNPSFFYVNVDLFSESQKHNSCLNRKISIDVNGEIRNCPSLLTSYGNISSTSLQSALAHKNFKDRSLDDK